MQEPKTREKTSFLQTCSLSRGARPQVHTIQMGFAAQNRVIKHATAVLCHRGHLRVTASALLAHAQGGQRAVETTAGS